MTKTKSKTPAPRELGQRLLNAGYASMLRHVQIEPSTARAVAEKMACSPMTISKLMLRMADLGIIHEIDWVSAHRDGRGKRVAVYAFGPGDRTPYAPYERVHTISKWNISPELVGFSKLILALCAEPQCTADLVEVGGHFRSTICRLMLHCQDIKLVRVAAWMRPTAGPPRPMFMIGSKPDAPKPQAITDTESNRRYRNRKKSAAAYLSLAAVFQTRPMPAMAEAA